MWRKLMIAGAVALGLTVAALGPAQTQKAVAADGQTEARPPAPPRYYVGDRVWALWGGKWWDAVILKVSGESYYIHYVGYGSDWDEWVGPDRLSY